MSFNTEIGGLSRSEGVEGACNLSTDKQEAEIPVVDPEIVGGGMVFGPQNGQFRCIVGG